MTSLANYHGEAGTKTMQKYPKSPHPGDHRDEDHQADRAQGTENVVPPRQATSEVDHVLSQIMPGESERATRFERLQQHKNSMSPPPTMQIVLVFKWVCLSLRGRNQTPGKGLRLS